MRVEAVAAASNSAVHIGVRDPVEQILGQRVEMPVGPAAAAHRVKNIPIFHIVAGADDAVLSGAVETPSVAAVGCSALAVRVVRTNKTRRANAKKLMPTPQGSCWNRLI